MVCQYISEFMMSYTNVTSELVPDWIKHSFVDVEYNPYLLAAFGSIAVGLSGVLPLLIIPIDETVNLKHGAKANMLKVLLSFAVGGLLGDVFLHLLPEAWANDLSNGENGHPSLHSGFLVLAGLTLFISVEKLFSGVGKVSEPVKENHAVNNNVKELDISGKAKTNGYIKPINGIKLPNTEVKATKHVSGYLNLLANSIDNFTHGLAVGGSFLISMRLGFFTTFAILVHEIPHEVGDFAILLNSGFSRWDAAFGQIITASIGLLGSLVAVSLSDSAETVEAGTSWILPFTAGGFLHIALVSILPDLKNEENTKESVKQLFAMFFGICMMAFLTTLE